MIVISRPQSLRDTGNLTIWVIGYVWLSHPFKSNLTPALHFTRPQLTCVVFACV